MHSRSLAFVSPTFPNEIVDHIVGYLWNDLYTLKSCALTSRKWSAIVRPYVFRSIALDQETKVEELETKIEETSVMHHWIREVRIVKHWAFFKALCLSEKSAHWAEKLNRLHGLVFKEVRRLSYLGLTPPEDEWETLSKNLASFHTIQSLTFVDCHILTSVLALIVNSLPNLQSLALYHCCCHDDSSPFMTRQSMPPPGRAPALTHLIIHGRYSRVPVSSIISPKSLKTLQCLQLREVGGEWGGFMYIKDHVGPALQTFRMDLPSGNMRVEVWLTRAGIVDAGLRAWDASHLEGLRKVHLGSLVPSDTVLPMVLAKLEDLPVETITLDVSFDFIGQFKPQSFSALNKCFGAGAFESLKTVGFLYRGTVTPKKAHARIKQVFPALPARGVEIAFTKVKDRMGISEWQR